MSEQPKQMTLGQFITFAMIGILTGGTGGAFWNASCPQCSCCLKDSGMTLSELSTQCCDSGCGGACCGCKDNPGPKDPVEHLKVKTLAVTDSITVRHPSSEKGANIVATEKGVSLSVNGRKLIGEAEAEEPICADNKILLYFFTADWCGPCQKLKADTFQDAVVKTWMDENVTLFVAGDNRPLMKKYNVTAFPTLIFFGEDRQELGRMIGYHGARSFLSKVKQITGR